MTEVGKDSSAGDRAEGSKSFAETKGSELRDGGLRVWLKISVVSMAKVCI